MSNDNRDKLTDAEKDVHRYLQLSETMKDSLQEQLDQIKEHTTEFGDVAKRFVAHFDVFKSISKDFSDQISTSIKNSARDMSNEVVKDITDRICANTETSIKELNNTVLRITDNLEQVPQKSKLKNGTLIGLSCLVFFIAGFVINNFVSMRYTVPLDKKFMAVYSSGLILEQSWPKLTQAEKSKILDLAKGKS